MLYVQISYLCSWGQESKCYLNASKTKMNETDTKTTLFDPHLLMRNTAQMGGGGWGMGVWDILSNTWNMYNLTVLIFSVYGKFTDRWMVVVVGVFFLACEDFGSMFDNSFSACALLIVVFLKWRLVCAHWFHSLGQDQSTVAKQDEMTDRWIL